MPNRTLPSRTCVDPSCTATTKSSLMPIEQVASPRSSHRPRTRRKPGSGGLRRRPPWPDGHQPVDDETGRRVAWSTSASTCDGGAAALARLAGRVDLDQHVRPGRPFGELDDQRRAVDRLVHVDEIDDLAHLVGLQLADEVHGDAECVAGRTWPPAPGRSSPRSPSSPTAAAACTTSTRMALGDGEHLDVACRRHRRSA